MQTDFRTRDQCLSSSLQLAGSGALAGLFNAVEYCVPPLKEASLLPCRVTVRLWTNVIKRPLHQGAERNFYSSYYSTNPHIAHIASQWSYSQRNYPFIYVQTGKHTDYSGRQGLTRVFKAHHGQKLINHWWKGIGIQRHHASVLSFKTLTRQVMVHGRLTCDRSLRYSLEGRSFAVDTKWQNR